MIKDSKIHYITFFMSGKLFQLDKILDEIILVPDNLRKKSPLPSSYLAERPPFLVGPHPSAADCVKAQAPAPCTQCNVIDGVTQIKKKTTFSIGAAVLSGFPRSGHVRKPPRGKKNHD